MPQRNERADLARAVMELIDAGHRRISRHLDLTRVRVLGTVAARQPVRPNAIAAELGLTASATSRHLAALEEAGQIAVEPDPVDSRTFLVRQTESGRADAEATVAAGAAVFADVISDWTDEDVTTARELITRLNEAWATRGDAASAAQRGSGPRWRRKRQSVEGEDQR
ncbi:MarR family winged helix-turn-helix transcriptional regulator [Amycolatopsis carbonis]|uniref:MarR family winged helix-turn-helix transcriptional regulator n=1 Tax=Amycolatopsis carbonis TaxID=715471 RepID=A0A9Y2INK4_9PSEU|nr:MarR family winged helix-turn-helix transcriptional regulator [Amycolatopsis sp. 2-15]WIX82531.1 MarR family winged helix-turn-helix transcriptional regulator [Amycolatopsis sp. 2-15]